MNKCFQLFVIFVLCVFFASCVDKGEGDAEPEGDTERTDGPDTDTSEIDPVNTKATDTADVNTRPSDEYLPGGDNTALSNATVEEISAMCVSIIETEQKYMSVQFVESICEVHGVMVTIAAYSMDETDGLREMCEHTMDECMATIEEEDDMYDPTTECVTAVDMNADGCDATISELQGCADALNVANMEFLKEIGRMLPTCAELTPKTLETIINDDMLFFEEPPPPAACDVIVEECPDLAVELGIGGDDEYRGFECADNLQTIPVEWVCDGIEDCFDGSDEADC